MSTPTILYRRLDDNGDPIHGNGRNAFATDLNAVSQAILTRLKFLTHEWFEDLSAGTPLFDSMLGKAPNVDAVSLIIQQRITGTPYVTGVSNVAVSWDASKRSMKFSCGVSTRFGSVLISSAV